MNTRQLLYIKKVLDAGGISLAAAELRISQPSLSQMIKNVEKSLDIAIFNRDKTPITLTYAGEKYIEAAEKILDLEKQLLHDVKEIKDESYGRIKLGISIYRAIAFLPEILYLFKKEYPNVHIDIVELGSHGLENYAKEKIVDIAFVTSGQSLEEMIYRPIRVEKIYLVAGKNTTIAKKIPSGSAINIKEAKNEEFIFIKKGHAIRAISDQLFKEHSISPSMYFETDSIELGRRLALYCDKAVLYPKIIGAPMVQEEREGSYYEIKRPQEYKTFCLTYRQDLKLKTYMERFIDISLAYLESID